MVGLPKLPEPAAKKGWSSRELLFRSFEQHQQVAQEFWVDTHRRVGGFCGIRQLCEQFPTHFNEVCLQGFAALVNSARDVPRTFSGDFMRWVPVKMTDSNTCLRAVSRAVQTFVNSARHFPRTYWTGLNVEVE